MDNKEKRDGKRPGAGRPKSDNLRILRGLKFSDQEWEIIKKNAAENGLSARAYISSLVESEQNGACMSAIENKAEGEK